MAKFLLVGCGDLGAEVAKHLVDAEHSVTGVRFSDKPLAFNMTCIQADVTDASTMARLSEIKPEVIVYCVAAKAQTDASYRAHYVDGLRNILATQQENANLRHVFFISSTRVYGQATSQLIDEATEPFPVDFGGERLLEAEALLKELPCNATAIRLSGIYGPGRLYLVNMAKDPNRWPEGDKWTNRIHRDDAAAFIAFLCEKVVVGDTVEELYIGTDDSPTLQYDVLKWLASQLNMPSALTMKCSASQTLTGKRLCNKRLRKTGFALKYPSYRQGYAAILKEEIVGNG